MDTLQANASNINLSIDDFNGDHLSIGVFP